MTSIICSKDTYPTMWLLQLIIWYINHLLLEFSTFLKFQLSITLWSMKLSNAINFVVCFRDFVPTKLNLAYYEMLALLTIMWMFWITLWYRNGPLTISHHHFKIWSDDFLVAWRNNGLNSNWVSIQSQPRLDWMTFLQLSFFWFVKIYTCD